MLIGVPLQCELSGQGRAALADIDGEGGAADRAGQRAGERFAARRGRCRNNEAHGRRGGLGLAGLTQQKHRPAGALGAGVQPPRRGKVEKPRAAADLEEDGGEGRHAGGLLGDPQRVDQFRRFGKQQLFGLDAEEGVEAPGIGKAGLAVASPDAFLNTGVERLDTALGGGLPKAALSEIHGLETRDAGAVAGIAGLQPMD
ncbi:hypothetical protein EOA75_32930, partial [Mesorhizobium sp. M1A.F.Ca.IN.022.07.1.1]